MAVVAPDEALGSFVSPAWRRIIGAALSPVIAGFYVQPGFPGTAFILSGGLKIVYDLASISTSGH
jgi:hypothetical protein